MTLTRKMLKAMGIEEDKIEQIIEAHTETVEGLKGEIGKYKTDAEALPEVQKQLESVQADLEAGKKDSYKVKYETIKEEFEEYKQEQEKKEAHAAKEKAYRQLLKDAGISEKRLESVLKVSDMDSVELDDKGMIKDIDKLREHIKNEWADFIVTTETRGADTAHPPINQVAKMYSREDIRKMTPAEINQNFDAIKASLKGEK